jgi:hypothetical protein
MGFTRWDCPPDVKFTLDTIDFETGVCESKHESVPLSQIVCFVHFDGSPITYRSHYKSPLDLENRLCAFFEGKQSFIVPRLNRIVFALDYKQCSEKFKGNDVYKLGVVKHLLHVIFGEIK